MRRGIAYVEGRHPGLLCCAVERVTIDRHVCADDKAVNVIGRYRHLHLGDGHTALPRHDVDLLAIGGGLQALTGPDRQPLVGVDIAGDVCEIKRGHW